MGLFNFKKDTKKEKKSTKPVSKKKEEPQQFEIGSDGIIFNAKIQLITKSKDYAAEVAKGYVNSITSATDQKSIKKYYVIQHSISKPEKISPEDEEKKELEGSDAYKIILDFDIGVKQKTKMFDFCFEYMPFLVEILEPMTIPFSASDLTDYVTSIQSTLHKIDEQLKQAKMINNDVVQKYQVLTKNMVRMLRNNILLSLKEKNKTVEELSKNTGIPEDQLKPFLDTMTKDKEVKFDKKKYALAK